MGLFATALACLVAAESVFPKLTTCTRNDIVWRLDYYTKHGMWNTIFCLFPKHKWPKNSMNGSVKLILLLINLM